MGLSHPPGWDNISPDVKIGGYSCLKSEKRFSCTGKSRDSPIRKARKMFAFDEVKHRLKATCKTFKINITLQFYGGGTNMSLAVADSKV